MAWVQCPPLPLCAAPPLSLGAQRALLSGEGQQLGAERWEGAAGGALSQERPQGKSRRGATAPEGQAGKHRCGPAPREPPIRRTGGSLVSRCTALHGAGPPVTRLSDGSKPHPGPQSMRPVWPGAQRVCAAGLRGG